MPLHRNIQRIDDSRRRTHAWLVIVQRRSEIVRKWFSDGIYEDKEKALDAAIVYRDILLSGQHEFEYQVFVRSRIRRNNTSGISGVGRYEVINSKTGNRSPFWTAYWADEHGRRRSRKFSVVRYGEKNAKRLATTEREHQLLRVCALRLEKP